MASLVTFTTLIALVGCAIAKPSYDGRIISGLLAPEHSFPFLVGLSITKGTNGNGTWWCGGSLIAPNLILTAAHCVYGGTIDVKVKLAMHNRRAILPHCDLIQVHPAGITIHEKFDPNVIENDIALIKLPLNVTLTDDIQLIQLASPYMDEEFLQGLNVTAAGWGKIGDNTIGISENLNFVDVTILDQNKCKEFYSAGIITSKNICIDGSDIKGTCSGDSGGPLIYQAVDDIRYLVGVTSFGSDQGCEKGYPAAFTRITSFLDWISEHTGLISN